MTASARPGSMSSVPPHLSASPLASRSLMTRTSSRSRRSASSAKRSASLVTDGITYGARREKGQKRMIRAYHSRITRPAAAHRALRASGAAAASDDPDGGRQARTGSLRETLDSLQSLGLVVVREPDATVGLDALDVDEA